MSRERQTAAVTHGCSSSQTAQRFLCYQRQLCARRPCCVGLDSCFHRSFVASECEHGCAGSPWGLARRHSEGTRPATLANQDHCPASADRVRLLRKSVDCPEQCEELCQDCERSPDQRCGLKR